jgi:hypothetical protein
LWNWPVVQRKMLLLCKFICKVLRFLIKGHKWFHHHHHVIIMLRRKRAGPQSQPTLGEADLQINCKEPLRFVLFTMPWNLLK